MPFLVYVGESDGNYPRIKEDAKRLPNTTFVSLPGLNHIQNLEADDEDFQVSGRATLVTGAAEKDLVHAAITFQFNQADPIFSLHLKRCFRGYWMRAGRPGT